MSLALECSAVAGVLGSITYFVGVPADAGAVVVLVGGSDSLRFARAFFEHRPARRVGLAVTVSPVGVSGFGEPDGPSN